MIKEKKKETIHQHQNKHSTLAVPQKPAKTPAVNRELEAFEFPPGGCLAELASQPDPDTPGHVN